MKILKLKIKNFRSFSNKETEIEISDKFNIFVGENGSGKTSIITAIRYALFGTQGMDIKTEKLVNSINRDNMYVTLILEKNNDKIVIERGRLKKQSYVKIWINDKELDLPSIKEYDKKIEELLGFNYKMFENFSINSQIFTKNFFKMKKGERDTFLRKVIGIDDFYQLIEKIKEIKKKYEYQKESIEKEILIYNNLLGEKEKRLKEIKSIITYQSKENIQKEREKKHAYKKELEKTIQKLIKDVKQEELLKSLEVNKKALIDSIEKEKEDLKGKPAINEEALEKVLQEIEAVKMYEKKTQLLKNAKQRFYQKIILLNTKRNTTINNLDKVTSAVEGIRQKGTYLNRITKGDIESFINKYGDGIIRFLFIADKRFYFEKEKIFTNAKIELSNSKKILKEYNEFKNSLLKLLKENPNNSLLLENIAKEKEELLKKYKDFIKPLLKEIKEIKVNGKYKESKKLEKLFEEKSEIEKQIRIQRKIKEGLSKIKELETKILKLKVYEGTLQEYNEKSKLLNSLNEELIRLESEYKKYEEMEHINKEIKKYQDELKNKKVILSELETKIKKCDEIIKKDSKEAIKKATEDFLKIFNYYIQKYIEELGIRFYVKIKNDFSFLLKERGKIIDYSMLSKGEETILNLLIVFALNETLKIISNIDFNLLIFDEIDGTLDEHNLKKVIKKLSELDKDIVFVSHRKEIFEIEESLKNMEIYEVKKDLFTRLERREIGK